MFNETNNHINDFLKEMDKSNPFEENEETTETSIPASIQEESYDEPEPEETEEQESETSEESESDDSDENDEDDSPGEPAQISLTDDEDEFEKAMKKCKSDSDSRVTGNLAAKNPIFKYASANEPITDKDLTFEDLRKKYETDFPELDEKKSVSWTVTYGKTTQPISNPNKEKIFEVKAQIEASKTFIDGLKKAKKEEDKNPDCIVKPFVTAQKKGDAAVMPLYKGFFFDADEAVKSPKAITYVPSRDGKIYEIRKNPIGIFQSPAKAIGEFPQLEPRFTSRLPKIPMFLLYKIVSFFRMVSKEYQLEALVHLLYDADNQNYFVKIPKQKLTKHSVDAVIEEYPENTIHVMDLHSHNTMEAKFSATDDHDEKMTRLYGVIGRLDKEIPDMEIRASNGGKFINLKFTDIFDIDAVYPEEWDDELNHSFAEAVCNAEVAKNGGDSQ